MPWIFAIVFFTLAPALIFYTAGYRINPKKVTIERNGTLIADSVPGGAHIFLNGTDTKRVTPSSLLSLPPGPYDIRYEKDGFLPWEKTLELKAEQATFADQARLWLTGSPSHFSDDEPVALAADDDQSKAAALFPQADGWMVRVLDGDGRTLVQGTLTELATTTQPRLRWNANGTGLILDQQDPKASDGWMDANTGRGGLLPAGDYAWDGSLIVGMANGMRTTFDPRRGTFSREQLQAGLAAQTDTFDLLVSTSTGDMTVRPHSILRRLYSLPHGTWTVDGTADSYTLLRHDDEWLAVARDGQPENGLADGGPPTWNNAGKQDRGLLLNQNEVWLWTPGETPDLLLRQSTPFVSAVWHHAGSSAFIATQDRVFALELDDRGGGRNMTDLATGFTRIDAMTAVGRSLLISGEKDGNRGLFLRAIE
ncbi:MAG TPA: PEGA domain-containing protein [Verrucomicrobiae bacterium]|nr:PEGA domain-containing protein [Verrucomicrobiae bacterium]